MQLITKPNLLAAFTMVVLTFTFAKVHLAQDVPTLTEKQKSVVLFDIRVAQAIEEAKSIGMDVSDLDEIPMEGPFEGIKVTQVKRVFGSASLPENLASAMAMAQGPAEKLPFEFFVRIEFADADIAEALEKKFASMSEAVEIGGKTYFRPEGGGGPDNVVAHRFDETSFEIGTLDYCQQPKRTFFTDRLKEAFKAAPNEPTRIVIDLESCADMIQEAVGVGKQQMGDPVSVAYFDLIDNANSIVITSSMATKNLLTVMIDGKDSEQAEELASGLAGLLGTAKIGAGLMFGQMEAQMPEEAKGSLDMMKQIVSSLAAQHEGNTVKIEVAKPDGFDEAMVQLQKMAATQAKKAERMNDFRQLGLGVLNYESAYRKFPFLNKDNQNEDLSWRVKILPFIEQNEMYDKMDLKKGPQEEPNLAFAESMPAIFGKDGKLANVSWIQSNAKTFGSVTDGSSNTIMLLENPQGRPWLEDNPLTVDEAIELVSGLEDGADLVAVRYDCSAFLITNKMEKEELRSMLVPNDGK